MRPTSTSSGRNPISQSTRNGSSCRIPSWRWVSSSPSCPNSRPEYHIDPVAQTCEDYRAAATIDLEDDRADLSAGRKLKIPAMKVLWGGMGMIEKMGGAVDVWKGYCGNGMEVTGEALDCGHYIPEERPEELLKEILEMMK